MLLTLPGKHTLAGLRRVRHVVGPEVRFVSVTVVTVLAVVAASAV